MKLKNHGKSTLGAEIIHISSNGIWLLAAGVEYFLPYENFPWFKNATVSQIYHVQLLHGSHLRWSDLDADLDLDSLNNLEKYPLVYK